MNQCWSLFGTAARLALAIGLHRDRNGDASGRFTLLERECRRRTFWNAYCLDNYLSVALGRPRIFHDEDIDQGLPLDIDDENFQDGSVVTGQKTIQGVMSAPVAYFK